MRTRVTVPEVTEYTGYCQWRRCLTAPDPPQNFSAVCTTKSAQIVDSVSSGHLRCGAASRAVMKPVEHSKWKMNLSTSSVDLMYYEKSHPWMTGGECVYLYVSNIAALSSSFMGVSDPGASAASWATWLPDPVRTHYDRWVNAKPTMATRANMAVFLGELRDIKRMFDYIPRKHFSLFSWDEVLKYANGLHLNWNFGWAPFRRDIDRALGGLATFERRLNKFLFQQDLSLIKHVADQTVSANGSSEWIGSPWGVILYKYDWSGTQKSRSTFQFSYTLPKFSWEELRWRAYLDTLGLAATPANIWALVPWSFVIDWFVGVGKYLDTFSDDWIEPWIYFCQACTSTKTEVEVTVKAKFQFGANVCNFDIGTANSSLYSRRVGIPEYVWNNPSSLDADKIRLLASLGLNLIV